MTVMLLSLLTQLVWLMIATCLIIISFIFYCRQYQWWRNNKAITQVSRDSHQQWLLYSQSTLRYSQLDLCSCVVTIYGVILYFKGQRFWQRYSLLIMADSVDDEAFRQLRVYCRSPKTFKD